MEAEAVAEVQPGDVLAGKYRVDKVLGAGGMGVVVQATHTVLQDRVALKFLLPRVLGTPSVAARFLREAQACVRIKSPHVARVIDVGTLESGSPYMVMEYLDGRDLSQVLEQEGRLDVRVACMFGLQACEALAAAHAAGVVHRDIKPANLFITTAPDGSPHLKVLDFGISKASNLSGVSSLTQTQVSMGSPLYMSPEQMRSARQADVRADIWSLGVVLYEMLTDTVPFMADSMPELIALVLETAAPPATATRPDLPAELAAVIARCLERDKEARFQTVADLAEALAPFAGEGAAMAAARCRRILDGAGRASVADLTGKHAVVLATSDTELAGGTATSFGATGTRPTPPARRTGLYVAAGAAVVLVAGALLLGLGRHHAEAAAASPSAEPAAAAQAAAAPSAAPEPAPPESAAPAPAVSEVAPATSADAEDADAGAKRAPAKTKNAAPHRVQPSVNNFFDERK